MRNVKLKKEFVLGLIVFMIGTSVQPVSNGLGLSPLENKKDMFVSNPSDLTNILLNNPPEKPDLSGEIEVEKGKNAFYFTQTIDSDGDDIYYNFSFGDGMFSGWDGPYNSGEEVLRDREWNELGTFEMKVKAKDAYDAESNWSDSLEVVVKESVTEVQYSAGFGVSVIFKNVWSKPIRNMSWSIELINSIYGIYNASGFMLLGRETSGSRHNILSHGDVTLRTRFLLGLGDIFSNFYCSIEYEDGSQASYNNWFAYFFVIGPFTIMLPDPWEKMQLEQNVKMHINS